MSDENNNEDKRMQISVSVDRNAEINALNEELARAKLELENLKKEREILEGKKAPDYKGAELNSAQLGYDENQSVFGADLPVDMWQLSSEDELRTKLNEALDGKYGNERKAEAINFNKQLRQTTSKVAYIRNQEFELESKPMNRFEFQGIGKPAKVIKKEDFKKPKMVAVKRGAEI